MQNNVLGGQIMIKRDCFALRDTKEPSCEALQHLYCGVEDCSFYKPKAENDERLKRLHATKDLKKILYMYKARDW